MLEVKPFLEDNRHIDVYGKLKTHIRKEFN